MLGNGMATAGRSIDRVLGVAGWTWSTNRLRKEPTMIRTRYVGLPLMSLTVLLLLICGCKSHEVVPSSGPRAPTRPEDVKIYPKHPEKYERLGVVSVAVTPEVRFDENGNSNLGFDRLKAAAAQRGANGLLFPPEGVEGSDAMATVGYHGKFYQVPLKSKPRTAMAEAIYVIEE